MRNLVILNLAPSGPLFGADADDPPFLSEAWWGCWTGSAPTPTELGAYLWFYDQLGFSGADLQARLVQERPEFAGQWLAADGSVSARGFDYLSRTACAVLLDRVHGEFERRLGHRFGRVIVGSFQDELPVDAHLVGDLRRGVRRQARASAVLPSDGGPDRSSATTSAPGPSWPRRRSSGRWPSGTSARAAATAATSRTRPAPGIPWRACELYADYARTHRWFSAPGSDHHGDARVHSSLAHLYGRPRTWIEAFHSSGWGGTLEETFDWLLPWLRAGATLYNPHAVYYSTKARLVGVGAAVHRLAPAVLAAPPGLRRRGHPAVRGAVAGPARLRRRGPAPHRDRPGGRRRHGGSAP